MSGATAGGGVVREGPVVTLDGPAGSGKSTTAREVARRLGFRHLDSGALYRALTFALLEDGVDPSTWGSLPERHLHGLGIRMEPTAEGFEIRRGPRTLGEELRSERVTAHVSQLASLPAVRGCLLAIQREAGTAGRLVADGRDMGTVVFPDAEVKVYLVADLRERARRRLREQGAGVGEEGDLAAEAERLAVRDRRDSERAHSPLRKPTGAWELDTTGLDFEAQVEAVVQRVRELTTP